ncbi:MAG: adenylyltransferase/cytidyltransferase family protein [Flavobacteriales bacterium]
MNQPLSLDTLLKHVATWKSQGKTIVFTNGVFDILHLGHATYLEKASAFGDMLIVGVNADESVRRLGKGPERPIHTATDRATLLSALKSVSATVLFEEDTPLNLIRAIQPDVLVKGGDYDPNSENPLDPKYMVGSDLVRATGGQVVAIDLVPGHSTTGIIHKSSSK